MKQTSKSDKSKSKRMSKKISIRKHLPLLVRVHYDAVKNFSPSKLFGLGVMGLVAVFGVLLATQTISPTTSAETNYAGTTIVSNFLQISTTINFSVSVASTGSTQRTIEHVGYHENSAPGNSIRIRGCSTTPGDYEAASRRGPSAAHYEATVAPSSTNVCIMVRFRQAVPLPNGRSFFRYGFHGPYNLERTTPIPTNQLPETSTPTNQLPETSTPTNQLPETSTPTNQLPEIATNYANLHTSVPTSKFVQISATQATFDASVMTSSMTLQSVKYYATSQQNVLLAQCSVAPSKYKGRTALKTGPPNQPSISYKATIGADDKTVCIMVSFRDGSTIKYGFHGPFSTNSNERFGITLRQDGSTYIFETNRDVLWSHKYLVNATVHVVGAATIIYPECVKTFVAIGNRSDEYRVSVVQNLSENDYHICIRASDGHGNYGYKVVPVQVGNEDPATDTGAQTDPTNRQGQSQTTTTDDITETVATDTTVDETPDTTASQTEETTDTTETTASQTEEATIISETGVLDDEGSWAQLGGYVLLAAAALGAARILVIKKYKKIS